MLKGKHVVLGVTGSIAAYKSAGLASMLVKAGCQVQVIMTEHAANFIHPMTFETLTGKKCLMDTFDRNFEYSVEHVALAKQADAVMIAPATANVIAKLAHGLADDMLTTTVLACRCKKLIAPAMNTAMFENQAVKDNLVACQKYGMEIIQPVVGHLACGDTGAGKMPEPAELFDYVEREIGFLKDLSGKRILVTAGPTREAVDPVRYLTNHSTGKMGYAIAKAAALRGAAVTLVTGITDTPKPGFVTLVEVESAADMFQAVTGMAKEQDIIIKAAAVADYRPKSPEKEKLKKKDDAMLLELLRTEDILKRLGEQKKPGQFLCGFSMETQNMIENARNKLEKKKLDMIVANNLKEEGAGFGGETNVVTILTKDSEISLPRMTKDQVAHRLLDEIAARLREGKPQTE